MLMSTRKHKPGAGRPCGLPASTYSKLARLLAEGKLSKQSIADECGVSRSYVKKLAAKIASGQAIPERPTTPYKPMQAIELTGLVAAGMTVRKAARRVNMPLPTAIGVIRHRAGGAAVLREGE